MNTAIKILCLILGLLIGLGLAVVMGLYMFFDRARVQQRVERTQLAATITAQMSITPTVTPVITPNPQTVLEEVFNKAESYIEIFNLEKASELLLPLIDQELTEQNYARLYADLAKMELYSGHTRLACNYYEKLLTYERLPETVYDAAGVCYASGLLHQAMAYYEELVNWEGAEADEYREAAQTALDHIRLSIGLESPTPEIE